MTTLSSTTPLAAAIVLLALGAAPMAVAADLGAAPPPLGPVVAPAPAVSGVNAKISGFGGSWDGDTGTVKYGNGVGGAAGAFTLPLGNAFGLQVDGLAGSWGGDGFYGVGGHLFRRDPAFGLLGLYGNYLSLDRGGWTYLGRNGGVDMAIAAAEGEYYLSPQVTLRGVAGWEGGDIRSGFVSKADFVWYATPDWALIVGHRYSNERNVLALGTEVLAPWQTASGTRAALFAEGRIGEDESRGVWAGVRLYFGASQTLVGKHRRDDPSDWLPDNLFSIQNLIHDLDQRNVPPPRRPPIT